MLRSPGGRVPGTDTEPGYWSSASRCCSSTTAPGAWTLPNCRSGWTARGARAPRPISRCCSSTSPEPGGLPADAWAWLSPVSSLWLAGLSHAAVASDGPTGLEGAPPPEWCESIGSTLSAGSCPGILPELDRLQRAVAAAQEAAEEARAATLDAPARSGAAAAAAAAADAARTAARAAAGVQPAAAAEPWSDENREEIGAAARRAEKAAKAAAEAAVDARYEAAKADQ